MIKKQVWSLERLEDYFKSHNLELDKKYYDMKITRETRIDGTCIIPNCQGIYDKSFRTLIEKGGLFCRPCAIKQGVEKATKTKSKRKIDIDYIHDFLKRTKRPIVCLSKVYENNKAIMEWKCENKNCLYEWKASFSSIKACGRCVACTKVRKNYTIETVQKYLNDNDRGITCLSKKYVNSRTPMLWRCETCEYTWSAIFLNIRYSNTSCVKCARKRITFTIKDVHKWLVEHNKPIECLSTEYMNTSSLLLWKCKVQNCGHEWSTCYSNIRNGTGCAKCAQNLRWTVESICKYLKDERRPIKCLSTEYKNKNSLLIWKCTKTDCNHRWKTTFDSIKNGHTGCPNCSSFRTEKLCREILESYTGLKFPKRKPAFLEGQEYDGFNFELKLAFEYHGLQHYDYVPYYHRGDIMNLYWQLWRDLRKQELSSENGVRILVIPYTAGDYRSKKKLTNYIISEYDKLIS